MKKIKIKYTGFPGWHLECSAMSMKYLGEHFDIHTGGVDHINIHHTNEIAQSEAASGKKFVNYWIHGEFLIVKSGRMGKSVGNFITLKNLEEEGFSALDYKYFLFGSHYRKQLMFSKEALTNAKNSYLRIKNIISSLKGNGDVNKKYLSEFENKINNDLDMPGALAVLWDLLRDKDADGKINTIKEMDKIFGLDLLKKEKVEVPVDVLNLAEKRKKLRKDMKWDEADKVRSEIVKKGWEIQDTEEGFILKKK